MKDSLLREAIKEVIRPLWGDEIDIQVSRAARRRDIKWQEAPDVCVCLCVSYHKGDDAPLCRLPFKAAVDVRPVADKDHDAPLHAVKVLLQQLKDTNTDQLLVTRLRSCFHDYRSSSTHLLGDFWFFLDVFLLCGDDGPQSGFNLKTKTHI